MPKQQDKGRRTAKQPDVANDNQAAEQPQQTRGDALTLGGNKIHGDELEGIIPGRPWRPHTDRESK